MTMVFQFQFILTSSHALCCTLDVETTCGVNLRPCACAWKNLENLTLWWQKIDILCNPTCFECIICLRLVTRCDNDLFWTHNASLHGAPELDQIWFLAQGTKKSAPVCAKSDSLHTKNSKSHWHLLTMGLNKQNWVIIRQNSAIIVQKWFLGYLAEGQ